MAIETREKSIDGKTYSVTQLPFGKGRKLFYRVAKALVPSFAVAMRGAELKDGLNTKMEDLMPSMVVFLERAVTDLDEETFEYTIDVLAASTTIQLDNGKTPLLKDVMESEFSGEYITMFKWLAFALQVNFANRFLDNGGLLSAINQSAKNPSQYPKG